MKPCSNVCNRCRLVCVKFYLIGADMRLLLQNVKGLTFLGHMVYPIAVVGIKSIQQTWGQRSGHYFLLSHFSRPLKTRIKTSK